MRVGIEKITEPINMITVTYPSKKEYHNWKRLVGRTWRLFNALELIVSGSNYIYGEDDKGGYHWSEDLPCSLLYLYKLYEHAKGPQPQFYPMPKLKDYTLKVADLMAKPEEGLKLDLGEEFEVDWKTLDGEIRQAIDRYMLLSYHFLEDGLKVIQTMKEGDIDFDCVKANLDGAQEIGEGGGQLLKLIGVTHHKVFHNKE